MASRDYIVTDQATSAHRAYQSWSAAARAIGVTPTPRPEAMGRVYGPLPVTTRATTYTVTRVDRRAERAEKHATARVVEDVCRDLDAGRDPASHRYL